MKSTFLALSLLLAPFAMRAQDIKPFDVKTGLWESTTTTEMSGLPAMPAMPQLSEEQLSKMPPQARAQVEAMMKNKGGVGAPRTTTGRSCITKETLSQAWGMNQQNCTSKLVSSSGSQQKIHMECNMQGSTAVGDLTVDRVDDAHAKGTMTLKTTVGGSAKQMGPVDMKMSFSSKWVGSDCGDVKPVTVK